MNSNPTTPEEKDMQDGRQYLQHCLVNHLRMSGMIEFPKYPKIIKAEFLTLGPVRWKECAWQKRKRLARRGRNFPPSDCICISWEHFDGTSRCGYFKIKSVKDPTQICIP